MHTSLSRNELIHLVTAAAKPIDDAFGLPLAYQGKEGRTDAAAAVTAIDRTIQATLMEKLPGDFMGEEDGQRITGSSQVWLTDPLDGTGALIRGLASATCIVTLMQVADTIGKPILTVIHNPVTQQTWSAELGNGAYYQRGNNPETRCHLDRASDLPAKILSTIALWPGIDHNFDTVKQAVENYSLYDNQGFEALGAAHASVASGTTHLSACRASAAYETAAATLLMQEAGGVACNLQGVNFMQIGFPIQDVRGKQTFAIPQGAVIASSEAVAKEFLMLVHKVNS